MNLTGLHLLLTYECTLQCDHCFVFGNPWQTGTMSSETIKKILNQAKELGTVKTIYFEGGEPFLYYPILLRGVELAYEMGFDVGLVSNGFWGLSKEDAFNALSPMHGKIKMLSLSCDQFHWDNRFEERIKNIESVAEELGIETGVITITKPEKSETSLSSGTIATGESQVMFRGRAAEKLTENVDHYPWESFSFCPHEDLVEPGRIHIDPSGDCHICQGISLGNLFEKSLKQICLDYDPHKNPISGPILKGGPAELVRVYDVPHNEKYADTCHLCFTVRKSLREKFPNELTPDQMYQDIN